jgi:mRNA interferase RelE/StbE
LKALGRFRSTRHRAKSATRRTTPDKPTRKRVSAAIDALATNPRPQGAKVLTGMTRVLRVRLGDYRIVYQVQDDQLVVLVIDIGHRREIYR